MVTPTADHIKMPIILRRHQWPAETEKRVVSLQDYGIQISSQFYSQSSSSLQKWQENLSGLQYQLQNHNFFQHFCQPMFNVCRWPRVLIWRLLIIYFNIIRLSIGLIGIFKIFRPWNIFFLIYMVKYNLSFLLLVSLSLTPVYVYFLLEAFLLWGI